MNFTGTKCYAVRPCLSYVFLHLRPLLVTSDVGGASGLCSACNFFDWYIIRLNFPVWNIIMHFLRLRCSFWWTENCLDCVGFGIMDRCCSSANVEISSFCIFNQDKALFSVRTQRGFPMRKDLYELIRKNGLSSLSCKNSS